MLDELNPVLTREVRARWRNWPAFLVVLCYAALLAGTVGWRYSTALAAGQGVTIATAPQLGRELFGTITVVQALGWMLLAPVLTATAIAGERERGTLGNLHLSCLTPYQICAGKLLSALSFIALMLLVPLPIMAVCFPLGGVSPAEFVTALLLHTFTAITCASIGLFCSAGSRRSVSALGMALIIIALWCVIPPLCFLSPLFAAQSLEHNGLWLCQLSIAFQLAVPFILLRKAAAAMLKPLPELAPVLTRSQLPGLIPDLVAPPARPAQFQALPATPGVRAHGFARQQLIAADAPPQSHAAGDWRRLPLVSLLSFDNPVLQREVRIRLQMREGAWGTESQTSPGCWLTIGVFFLLFGMFIAVADRQVRFITWTTFSFMWLVAIIVGTTLMGALAFSREREQGMLQPLLLSLLTRREIIGGKVVGSLVVCSYYSLAMIPVLLPCLRGVWLTRGADLSDVFRLNLHADSLAATASGITVTQALAVGLVLAATAWSCTACGISLSWFCRQTWVAIGWALALEFLALVALPLCVGAGGGTFLWHPYFAMQMILRSGPVVSVQTTLCFVGLHGCAGSLGLVLVQLLMRRGDRGQDGNGNLHPEYAG